MPATSVSVVERAPPVEENTEDPVVVLSGVQRRKNAKPSTRPTRTLGDRQPSQRI